MQLESPWIFMVLWRGGEGGERGWRRKSRKRGVKGQVLKFSFCSGKNSRFFSGEIQSPYTSLSYGWIRLRQAPQPAPGHPRLGLKDYTLRVNAFKTQPSTLHISPPNLEINAFAPFEPTTWLSSNKLPFKVLVLDPFDIFVIIFQLHLHLSIDFHTQPHSKED